MFAIFVIESPTMISILANYNAYVHYVACDPDCKFKIPQKVCMHAPYKILFCEKGLPMAISTY